MKQYLAQGLIFRTGTGPSDTDVSISGPLVGIGSLGDLVNKIVQFLVPIASIALFLILIWGGYDYLMSGGEPDKVNSGKAKITAALIGYILLIFSYVIAKFFGYIFGLGGGIL